jgi:hypothetical protein
MQFSTPGIGNPAPRKGSAPFRPLSPSRHSVPHKSPSRFQRGYTPWFGDRKIPVGGLDLKQVTDEKVFHPALAVGAAHAVAAVGDHEQIKILVGADQGVHKAQGGFGRDVRVHFSHDQEEFPLQPVCVVDVRRGGIPVLRTLFPDFVGPKVTHPLFVP